MTDTTVNRASSMNNNRSSGALTSSGSSAVAKVSDFISQPAFKRSMPLVISIIFAGVVLVFFALSQKPSLTSLYETLSEAEKAKMLEALSA